MTVSAIMAKLKLVEESYESQPLGETNIRTLLCSADQRKKDQCEESARPYSPQMLMIPLVVNRLDVQVAKSVLIALVRRAQLWLPGLQGLAFRLEELETVCRQL